MVLAAIDVVCTHHKIVPDINNMRIVRISFRSLGWVLQLILTNL